MKILTNARIALLVLFALIGYGLRAAKEMPKELYPDLEVPIVMIVSIYPGAPPELVEATVTNVIERELQVLPSINLLKSSSIESASIIMVEFDVSADFNEAFRSCQEAVASARGDLPNEVEKIDVVRARTTNAPVLTLNLVTDVDPREVQNVSELIQDRLEVIPGVSEVRISGLLEEQVQVLVNRHRLDEIGASLNDVVFSLQASQQEAPLGRLQTATHNYPLQVKRIGLDMERLRYLPVRSSATGRTVPLADVATVKRGLSEPKEFAKYVDVGEGGRELDTVMFDILRQPGGNLIDISDAAYKAIAELRHNLPPNSELMVTMDQSVDIKESISLLLNNGGQAVLLVLCVLFFFLGVRESLIAGLSIPLCFLATMIILEVLGYSINSLSLMALVIALGMLVDNFILVMEGMHDGIMKGKRPVDAAAYTLRTYGAAVFSGTLTTIAAFAPMAMLDGINGRFVRVLPITVSITLMVSYSIALSLDLAAGTALLRKHEANILTRTTDGLLTRLAQYYYDRLGFLVYGTRFRRVFAVSLAIVLFGVGVYVHQFTQKILYPDIKSPTIGATLYLPAGSNLSHTRELSEKVQALLKQEKDMISHFVITAGQMSSLAFTAPEAFLEPFEGEYILGLVVALLPADQRSLTSYEYAPILREKLKQVHSGRIEMHEKRLAPRGGSPIEVEITGDDPARVDGLARAVRSMMSKMANLQGLTDNRKQHSAGFRIVLDDQALKHHNLSRTEVLMFLRSAIEGKTAATVLEGDKQIEIVVAYDWGDDGQWNSPSSVEELEAMKVSGVFSFSPVPLAALGHIDLNTSPYGINHTSRQYATLLKAEHKFGSPVEIGATLRDRIDKTFQLEPSEAITVLGDLAKNTDMQEQLKVAFIIAISLIFTILVIQFGSFVQPLIILASLPLSLIGVFFGFALFRIDFSFPAMVGLVSLVGIVVNNAIVLIDTINRLRAEEGLDAREACRKAGQIRIRPILSTTITTVVGLLPLAFTDPVWEGLCLTIVFGLSLATLLTLGIVPALYIMLSPSTDTPPLTDGSQEDDPSDDTVILGVQSTA